MVGKADEIERVYTIPLRRGWLKEPRPKRTKRAIRDITIFLKKHTKSKEIKLSKGVNEMIFSRGFKKPPAKIKVEVKGDFESVLAKLPGEVMPRKKVEKKGVAAGLKERFVKSEGETKKDKKEEMKKKAEDKIKEATSAGKTKETAEKVKKEEGKTEEKKEFKEEKKKK